MFLYELLKKELKMVPGQHTRLLQLMHLRFSGSFSKLLISFSVRSSSFILLPIVGKKAFHSSRKSMRNSIKEQCHHFTKSPEKEQGKKNILSQKHFKVILCCTYEIKKKGCKNVVSGISLRYTESKLFLIVSSVGYKRI